MSVIRPSDSFPIIKCSNLIIKPSTTTFKWDFINKSSKVLINKDRDVARTNDQTGFRGVRSINSILVGTDEKKWVYSIINSGCVYVGLVNDSHDFDDLLGASIEQKIDVAEFDIISFNLSLNKLIIKHIKVNGRIKQYSFPLTDLNGQQLWPWISSSPGFRLGVWLYEDVETSIQLDEKGKLVMDSKDVSIGNIDINENCIEFKGSNGKITIPDSQTNAFEIKDSQNTFLNMNTSTSQLEVCTTLNTKNIITTGITRTGRLHTEVISTEAGANINITPDGLGEVLLKADPVSSLGAATKQYVDLLAQGLDPKESVRVVTVSSLPSYFQSGISLTANVNGSLNVAGIDSITNLVVGNRILVNNTGVTDDLHAGIYEIANLGDVSNPWILTRTADADDGQKLSAASYVFVEEGSLCGDSGWVMTANDPIIIGTTPITWVKFSQAGVIVAENVGTGAGIFRDKIDTKLNFKSLVPGSTKMNIINNTNDLTLDIDQTQITGTGNLDSGSITSNFGSINNGSSSISTTGTMMAGLLNVDNLQLDGNTLASTSGNISISPEGLGEVLLKADPVSSLGAATKQYTDSETNLRILADNEITGNPLNGSGFTTRQVLWDSVNGKTANITINLDGTITKTTDNQLASIYSSDVLDISKYNYTIRLTLQNGIANNHRWYTLGIYSDKKDFTGLTTAPLPGEDYDAFQHGVMWRWGFQGSGNIIATYSSQSPNENIGAVNIQRLRDPNSYIEFKIINGEIRSIKTFGLGTQETRNSLELVEGDNRSRLVDSKYYIGFHDTSTVSNTNVTVDVTIEQTERTLEDLGSDRLTTDYKRLSQNLDALDIQNQITANDTDILNLQTDLGTETTNRTNADTALQNQITSNDTDILNLQTVSVNLASTSTISSTDRNTQYIIKGYKNSYNLPAPSRVGQIINFVNIQNEQQYSGFLGTDLNGVVRAIVSTPPYTILGGQFTAANGTTHNRAVRFNHRTLAYEAFGSGFNDQIRSLHLDRDGTLWFGGRFTQYNGNNYEAIVSYDLKANTFSEPANQGINHSTLTTEVSVIKSYQNKVYMGGVFETVNNKTANNIVEYDLDTGSFTELPNDTTNGVNGQVRSFEILLDGGYIWMGGTFTAAGTVSANNFIQYEVQTNLWENVGNLDGDVYAIEKYDDSNLVVAGNFQNETKSATSLNYIAFYNIIRREWTEIPNTFGNRIEKVLVLPNGVIAVVGLQTVEQFDIWYKGEWFNIGSGFNSLTTALNYNQFLGTIEIGGSFTASRDAAVSLGRICQIPINSIIKYNGSVITSLLLGDNIELKARDLNYYYATSGVISGGSSGGGASGGSSGSNVSFITWTGQNNIGTGSPDQWLIPFNNESSSAHDVWSGRFYFPTNVKLTDLVILGDVETYNTMLTGFYTVSIYKENLLTGGAGSLIFTTNVYGRNSTNTPRFTVINGGNDPDNSAGSANVFFIVPISVCINAGEAISVYLTNLANIQGSGMEIKYFTYYNYTC